MLWELLWGSLWAKMWELLWELLWDLLWEMLWESASLHRSSVQFAQRISHPFLCHTSSFRLPSMI